MLWIRPPPFPWERLAVGPLGWMLGTPRARRRTILSVASALGLAVLAPVLAFLMGWVLFDVPSADESAVTQVARFIYADGTTLATIRPGDVTRVIVPIDQVPEHVGHAALAAEDPTFYANPGFDFTSAITGSDATITQQYVQVAAGQGGPIFGAATRRSFSPPRSPSSRRRTRSSRST